MWDKKTDPILCHLATQASSAHFIGYKPIYSILLWLDTQVYLHALLPLPVKSHAHLLTEVTGRKESRPLHFDRQWQFLFQKQLKLKKQKTVGTKKTLHKGTSFKVTVDVWTAVKCSFKLNVHLQDISSLGIVLLLMTISFDSTASRVFLFSGTSAVYSQTWDLQNKRQTNSFYFEFPETCCIKCFNGIYVMCVIAHNERYVGCASLCPLIPIIHLCGDLAVWIWLALFDKGTHTITSGSVKFLFLASKIAITFFFFFSVMYCKYPFNPRTSIHLTSELKPECFIWI